MINKIIHSAGYDDSEKLFLSSTIGKNKFRGDIYGYVVEQLGCNPEDILHIGDNYQSDILNAKANCLLICLIKKYRYLSKSLGSKRKSFISLTKTIS
ncbi:HAD-IA family hydrolase [Moorena sp. SIO4G3]|uniref:HAD-IA family hydrolase n=1 Tax=Moorena sp. SIO4G3 TaxID=2607821 RepID=UPI00142B9DB0|nr:HAD-IA family hydrolase [Moorena sp. SIO4G3]NEO80207.1 HAD-IA family hydrolase [Moorena sp. SIO4G3]